MADPETGIGHPAGGAGWIETGIGIGPGRRGEAFAAAGTGHIGGLAGRMQFGADAAPAGDGSEIVAEMEAQAGIRLRLGTGGAGIVIRSADGTEREGGIGAGIGQRRNGGGGEEGGEGNRGHGDCPSRSGKAAE